MKQNPKYKINLFILLVFYLIISLAGSDVWAESKRGAEFEFRFKKRILGKLDTHNLQIINRSPKRAVEFDFAIPENYYALLNNGGKIKIGSKIFEMGSNSLVCIEPGTRGYISFAIPKLVMQNAKEIIFKGMSYIPRRQGDFLYKEDEREFAVIVDVTRGTTAMIETEVIGQ